MTRGVYLITCYETGRRYVGSSKDIQDRWKEHIRILRGNGYSYRSPLFQDDWKKYGQQGFDFSVLEETEDYYAAEREWIDKLKPEYNSSPEATAEKDKKERERRDLVFMEEWHNPPPIDRAVEEEIIEEAFGEMYAWARQDARDYKAKKTVE